MTLKKLGPLNWQTAIVTNDGRATPYLTRYLQLFFDNAQILQDTKQPLDKSLTALSDLITTGIIVRTGKDTYNTRTITAGTGISITNGDGVSGNPVIASTVTQYTDEMARDAIGAALVAGSNVTITVNDAANTITIASSGGGGGGGSYIPLVDGSEPPNFITDGAGNLILVAI